MGNQFFPNVSLTNEIYQASKAPAVRALFKLPSGAERDELAQTLAQSGYTLDVPIDVWNWDAVTTMATRAQLGFSWVPSALQAPLNGAIGSGAVPAGAIKVSVNAADYPPFDPPVAVHVGTNLVGWHVFGKVYTFGPGAIVNGKFVVTDGETVSQDGVEYVARVTAATLAGMGTSVYFERVS